MPILASVRPASGDSPLSILPSSPFPIIHATIPRMNGQNTYDRMPATRAIIAFVPALPPEPVFIPPVVGGGGGVDILGGGGGGGHQNLLNKVNSVTFVFSSEFEFQASVKIKNRLL